MPPQVGKAGCGTGPVVVQGNTGAEEAKSPELKNKPVEQQHEKNNNGKCGPYRATTKESSNRKAELAASATSQQTTIWKTFNNMATAAGEAVGELTARAAPSVKQQDMKKLSQREYRQDMLPGEYFEVEKITPGSTNKTQTRERVEDLSRGDVHATRRHPEQERESTKSGLEYRLKGLNQGKELTPFEKKLVEEWDPKKKDNSIVSLSPINSLDSSGTKGPLEVQGYRVERGEADSNYRQVTYYDRDGNELLQGPSIQKQKMMKLMKRDHPQDMVPGENFEAERIRPGNTNETKTEQSIDFAKGRLRSEQERHATKSGLEERLKGLNSGKELTPFEKKIVEEWDPNVVRSKNDAIGTLSPILKLDSTGTRGGTEVEGYKVVRGGSGDLKTTYYDRHGNEILGRRTGGDAISTDGPMDYIAIGRVAGKFAVNTATKAGEKLAAKEALKAEADAVAKAEANAVAKAEANAVAKAETNAAAKVETNAAAKTETNAAKNSPSNSQSSSANKNADAGRITEGETDAAAKQAASGHKPSQPKSEPASTSRRTNQKEDAEEAAQSQEKASNRRRGKDWEEEDYHPRRKPVRGTEKISHGPQKMELQESPELRAAVPNVEHRREWMQWLEESHTADFHEHVRPGSRNFYELLQEWSAETGRHVNLPNPLPRH
jgi:hypothetical protein